MSTYEKLSREISDMPLIDVHTHVDLSHPSARGLHDLLLYHMVVSELYSAGCPDASRLSELPDDAEAEDRLLRAIPYIPYVRYSSCFTVLKSILRDLYGFSTDINSGNWRKLDGLIRERYKNDNADEILKKANITKINTEYCRKHGFGNDRFFYSLEWAFFTRSQYGVFDAPLLELEIAASQDKPEGPIPVTFDEARYASRRRIETVEQTDEAMEIYVSKIPFDHVVSLPTHFSTDIHYGEVTREQMAQALANRKNAGSSERDIYANYINNKYFEALNQSGKKAAVSISVGAEPLKYETGIKLSAETLYAIESLANKYPGVDFILFNGCDYQDTALSGIIRETRNVYASGFWWHNFFPSTIEHIIRSRLERIPINKWFGYFSDAYCADWAYGKSFMIRDCFARTLSAMVDSKFYSFNDAAFIAKQLLYQNAKDYFNI
jgi:glucuronate isomerase